MEKGGYDYDYAPDSLHEHKSEWVDANVNANFKSPVSVPVRSTIVFALTSTCPVRSASAVKV